MQPGYRQQVRQAGIPERSLDLLGDRAPLAGDQRRGDPAGRAWEYRVDPPCHLGAQVPQTLGPAASGLGDAFFGAGDPAGPAKGVADPANPGEVELALEITPTRQNLRRHRIKHRFEPDPVARVQLVACLRDMKPQAARLITRFKPSHGIGRDDNAPALLRQIDVDDPSGDGERSEVALQHRRLPLPGGFAHQCTAGGESRQRECDLAPPRMPAQCKSDNSAGDRGNDARPQRRLDLQRKINPDPGAKKHRQPEQAPLALGGKAVGKGGHNTSDPCRDEAAPFARDCRICHHHPIARVFRAYRAKWLIYSRTYR